MNNKSTDFIATILIIVMVIGFYLVLSNIQETQKDIKKISSNIEGTVSDGTVMPGKKATSTDESQNSNLDTTSIPTAIIFQAKSSPLLEPQTDLTVAVEKVTKSENGQVTLDIKVYTNNAESYSAIQPNNLFELINLSEGNQKPLRVKGSFDSMPPQSAVTGQVIFKVQNSEELILQIQGKDGYKHYRFNFENQSYEKAILG